MVRFQIVRQGVAVVAHLVDKAIEILGIADERQRLRAWGDSTRRIDDVVVAESNDSFLLVPEQRAHAFARQGLVVRCVRRRKRGTGKGAHQRQRAR